MCENTLTYENIEEKASVVYILEGQVGEPQSGVSSYLYILFLQEYSVTRW
jgi:hypothetical protein